MSCQSGLALLSSCAGALTLRSGKLSGRRRQRPVKLVLVPMELGHFPVELVLVRMGLDHVPVELVLVRMGLGHVPVELVLVPVDLGQVPVELVLLPMSQLLGTLAPSRSA